MCTLLMIHSATIDSRNNVKISAAPSTPPPPVDHLLCGFYFVLHSNLCLPVVSECPKHGESLYGC